MLLSELLSLFKIYLPITDDTILDNDYIVSKQGNNISIIYRTSLEVCGFTAIDIPIHTCPQHNEITLSFIKTKEKNMITQLNWYNSLKPILTKTVKEHSSIIELPISLLQLKLICEHYKTYKIEGLFLKRVK